MHRAWRPPHPQCAHAHTQETLDKGRGGGRGTRCRDGCSIHAHACGCATGVCGAVCRTQARRFAAGAQDMTSSIHAYACGCATGVCGVVCCTQVRRFAAGAQDMTSSIHAHACDCTTGVCGAVCRTQARRFAAGAQDMTSSTLWTWLRTDQVQHVVRGQAGPKLGVPLSCMMRGTCACECM